MFTLNLILISTPVARSPGWNYVDGGGGGGSSYGGGCDPGTFVTLSGTMPLRSNSTLQRALLRNPNDSVFCQAPLEVMESRVDQAAAMRFVSLHQSHQFCFGSNSKDTNHSNSTLNSPIIISVLASAVSAMRKSVR